MADFALSPDEVSSVCRQMTAQADEAPAHVAQIRGSDVGVGDFGGSGHEDVAKQYLRTIDDVIPGLLNGYSSAGKSMSDALAGILGAYAATEADAVDALRSIDVGDQA